MSSSNENRKHMDAALNAHLVPVLRGLGFKGSLPNFRRITAHQVDLLSVQHDKWGGGFVIEVAVSPPEGVVMAWGKSVPANKVLPKHLHPNRRMRLGPKALCDLWFRYDTQGDDKGRFTDVAREVLPYLTSAALEYWGKGCQPHPGSTDVLLSL
ncbi:DUF4304 domain-containing protein [Pseudomonas sp. TE3610]